MDRSRLVEVAVSCVFLFKPADLRSMSIAQYIPIFGKNARRVYQLDGIPACSHSKLAN